MVLIINKEPPELTKDQKNILNNIEHICSCYPFHIYKIKDINKYRIDIWLPLNNEILPDKVDVAHAVHSYLLVGEEYMSRIKKMFDKIDV